MPCNDGREMYWNRAANDHHRRMEKLMEAVLKDGSVPKKYRDAYEAEAARFKREMDLADKGFYADGKKRR